MHTWRSDYPTRHARAIIKTMQIRPPKKRVIHVQYTDPADRIDLSDHADPPTQSYSSRHMYVRLTYIYIYIHITCMCVRGSYRSCRPHPAEVFTSSRITSIDDADPSQAINTWMTQTPSISVLHFPLSNTVVHVSCQACTKTCESIKD